MNRERTVNWPVIGRVQHGEQLVGPNGKRSVKEYGSFIAKAKDNNMQTYIDKFDTLIKGAKSIDIMFLDDAPLTVRYMRYNQGGTACYCLEGENIAKQKVQNKWQDVECNASCSYAQKDEKGKRACNRVGVLRFLIPSVATDRIWIMKITGQESIENLKGYLFLQKMQGSLANKTYTIFLTQKLQTSSVTGKNYNNYILDIIQKQDFISDSQVQNTIPKTDDNAPQKQETVITKENTNVKEKTKQDKIIPMQKNAETKENAKEAKETKETKSKSKKSETVTGSKEKEKEKTETKEDSQEIDNYYAYIDMSNEIVETKEGEKEYWVGSFYDKEDKPHNIIVKPEYAKELQECELGTMVELIDLKEIAGRTFAMEMKFIQKMKKVA